MRQMMAHLFADKQNILQTLLISPLCTFDEIRYSLGRRVGSILGKGFFCAVGFCSFLLVFS
jgi:hypothetical protein